MDPVVVPYCVNCFYGKVGKHSVLTFYLHNTEQQLDPVVVPHCVNCFYGNVDKHSVLTNADSDRGFESCPGYEVKSPDCQSSLEEHGQWILEFPVTGRIIGRRADVTHPRPGSGSVPTVTELIFCENAVFTNFAIKEIYAMRNNNWICVNCFYGKVGKRSVLTYITQKIKN